MSAASQRQSRSGSAGTRFAVQTRLAGNREKTGALVDCPPALMLLPEYDRVWVTRTLISIGSAEVLVPELSPAEARAARGAPDRDYWMEDTLPQASVPPLSPRAAPLLDPARNIPRPNWRRRKRASAPSIHASNSLPLVSPLVATTAAPHLPPGAAADAWHPGATTADRLAHDARVRLNTIELRMQSDFAALQRRYRAEVEQIVRGLAGGRGT